MSLCHGDLALVPFSLARLAPISTLRLVFPRPLAFSLGLSVFPKNLNKKYAPRSNKNVVSVQLV